MERKPEMTAEEGGLMARASFTVEAALLMTIILPVLIALLITGFYLHDQAYLQGAVTELCAAGSNERLSADRAAVLSRLRDRRLSHSLMWARNVSASVSAGTASVSAQAAGDFPVPGLAARLTGNSTLSVKAAWSRKLLQPAPLIWKIRAVGFLVDEVLGS